VVDRRTSAKILIVEGQDDKFAVIGLLKHHIAWPDAKEHLPVFIEVGSSADEILRQGYLTAQLKASHVEALGVVLDADDNCPGRYQRIQELLRPLYPGLPRSIPKHGLIAANDDKKRFGVWLMPDNASDGCMEVFLRYLVPDTPKALWDHAVASVKLGRDLGAPCREVHLPKAELFTWLAWQDPPGYSPGMALTRKILDPHSPHAAGFVHWIRSLYEL
jgi:hypothetical protein